MIKINKMTRGRFGNKILQYNNLMQLASLLGTKSFCTFWGEGCSIFNLSPPGGDDMLRREEKLLTWREFLDSCGSNIEDMHNKFDLILDDPAYMLHNVFFQVAQKDPRNFLQINKDYKKQLPTDKVNIGIHFRGTDVLGADGNHGREIHKPEYYRNSIDVIEAEFSNTKYYLCTDDLNFESYQETIKYLEQKNCLCETGNINNHLEDFSTLAECDVLIASSSTFVVCAGFLGKPNKKIIHSQEWINKNLNHLPWHHKPDPEEVRKSQLSFDNFWVKVAEGGNEFYNAWKFV
tara:strand:+ start:3358 stop:4230 length:873 start_codon:yes stop_codon:yes gene_type:complete